MEKGKLLRTVCSCVVVVLFSSMAMANTGDTLFFFDSCDNGSKETAEATTKEKATESSRAQTEKTSETDTSRTEDVEETSDADFDEQQAIDEWFEFMAGTWDGDMPFETTNKDGEHITGATHIKGDLLVIFESTGCTYSIERGSGALVAQNSVTTIVINKIDDDMIDIKYDGVWSTGESYSQEHEYVRVA